MKCKGCRKEIDSVLVISKCIQVGFLKGNKIIDYGFVDEILETLEIACRECGYDLSKGVIE